MAFDGDTRAPYAFSPPSNSSKRQWVGYDDLKSVTIKVFILTYSQEKILGSSQGFICSIVGFRWSYALVIGSR